jgi:hypothetical protein
VVKYLAEAPNFSQTNWSMDASWIEQIPDKYREIYTKNWLTNKPRVQ